MGELVTRTQAIKLGLTRYFDGKPCKRGHMVEKYLNGGCVSCQSYRKKVWRENNTEVKSQRDHEYREAHKQERKRYKRRYEHHRRHHDPKYAILCRLRNRLNDALQAQQSSKFARLVELVGCSVAALVEHLEDQFIPGMTWENRRLWHIDHIRPCSSFDLTHPQQQKACFHYTNLRPMWAKDNILKGNRLPDLS